MPYLLPTRLDGDLYLVFLQEVLPQLINNVPAQIRRRMWFEHGGAPAHYSLDASNTLNSGNSMDCGCPINWVVCSPDFSGLDLFLWGHIKSLIYEDGTVDFVEDFVAQISGGSTTIKEIPGIFANVQRSVHPQYEACVFVKDRNFEQILWWGTSVVFFHFVE